MNDGLVNNVFLLSPSEIHLVTKKGKQGTILVITFLYVFPIEKYHVYKKNYSYVNLFPFHRINSALLIKLLQSLYLMNGHCQNLCSFDSTTLSEVKPIDFNCPWLGDEAEHRQSIEFSSLISNNIEPLGCSFHYDCDWLRPGATGITEDFSCPRCLHISLIWLDTQWFM